MDIPKVFLSESYLCPRKMYDLFQKSDVVLTCTVENYSRLEKNKIYYWCTSSHDRRWTIKIVLKREILFVFLYTTPLFKKVQFRILRENKEPEQQIEYTMTEVITHQLFVSEVCNKTILNPKNDCLRDDALIIQCKYDENELELFTLDTYYDERPCEKDMYEVSKSMLDLYRTGLYSDFSIKVADTTFLVHKVLLAARSKYFANLFISNRTIKSETVTGTPNSVHEVLIFLYSGELRVMTKLDMVKVLKLSNELQIGTLTKKCLNFYKTYLSPSTLSEIFELSDEHNLDDLKDVVKKYILANEDLIISAKKCCT